MLAGDTFMRVSANQPDPQMLKGTLPLLILALLRRGESYGYELAVQLHDAGLPHITTGTIYPLIARLEHARLISSYLRPSDAGPARKYYQLTDAGRLHLRDGTSRWDDLTVVVSALLHTNDGQESS